jgi:hypothetical protein
LDRTRKYHPEDVPHLYDHLVTRRAAPVDYDALSPEAQLELAEYAERCEGDTLGIGRIDPLTGLWRPLLPKPR